MVDVGQQVGGDIGAQVHQGLGRVDDMPIRETLVRQAVQQMHADLLRRVLGPRQIAAGKGQHAADKLGLGLHGLQRQQRAVAHAGQGHALPGQVQLAGLQAQALDQVRQRRGHAVGAGHVAHPPAAAPLGVAQRWVQVQRQGLGVLRVQGRGQGCQGVGAVGGDAAVGQQGEQQIRRCCILGKAHAEIVSCDGYPEALSPCQGLPRWI